MTTNARPASKGLGHVLLVDDDEAFQRVCLKLLGHLGYTAEAVAGGRDALARLDAGSFDLILSDVNMSGMSGIEVLRAVRERDRDVPVILMSGSPGLQTAVEAMEFGAFRYLSKPISLATLEQAVGKATHLHRLSRLRSEATELLRETEPTLPQKGRQLLELICRAMDWDFGALWAADNGPYPRCVGTWKTTEPTPEIAAFEQTTLASVFEVGRELPGRVWADGLPEWLGDLAADATCSRAASAAAAGLCSGFAMPLRAEGEVLLVIELFSRAKRAPDPALVDVLGSLGAQLASLILRERAEKRAAGAEASQRSMEGTLDAIMECVPALILTLDRAGKVQFINRPQHKQETPAMVGADWLQLLPAADQPQHRARLRRVLESGVAETYETTSASPEGGSHWFSTRLAALRQGEANDGAVLVAHDVTELKQAQAEAAAAQRLAAIGTLAAGVAHEINTPLQFVGDSLHFLRDAAEGVFALVGALQEAQRLASAGAPAAELQAAHSALAASEEAADLGYVLEAVPQAFERCLDGLGRVRTIVQALKEFAHPAEQAMAPLDLNRAISNTLTLARGEYKHVAELRLEFEADLPLVTCHGNGIDQVLLNLVINAAHAIAEASNGTEPGTIKVQTRKDGEDVVISVSDTGVGIPVAIAHRVFEPFFTTKGVGQGTGQGLALAWSVVKERHGGELSFESKPGAGTTFFIRLPIAGPAPAAVAAG